MNILIVDDNEGNRYLLSALLTGSGHNVTEAGNGEEAIRHLKGGGFDLLVSDILMPVMDGFQLIRIVRADEVLSQLPIIVYTATYTGREDEEFALKIGADRFIQKPCEPEVFIKAMNDVMSSTGLRAPKPAPEPDEAIFKLYNERLVRKLEQKMMQLEDEIKLRREASEALQISERKYRKLHETMMDGFVRIDTEGIIIETNESYRRMLGYEEDELLNLASGSLTPQKWHDYENRVILRQILERGFSDVYEKEYRKKDGEIIPVELRAFLIKSDTGENEGVWAIVRDITARKQAEEALRRANDIIVRSPAVAFVWKNAEGWPVLYASDNVERLFGYKAQEFISGEIPYANVIHPDDLARVSDEVSRARRDPGEETVSHAPYRIVDKSGKIKWVEDLTTIRRDEQGDVVAYEGLLIDITERIILENSRKNLTEQLHQAQKMESVGQLAGGVAHDFNNLLSVILGYSELLRLELGEESPHQDMLEEVIQASMRARDLTRQLLAFSRKQVLEIKTVDVSKVVTGFEKLLRRLIGEDVKLELALAEEPIIVKADAAQLEQVLMNLAVNSRDAMPDGGILTIETSVIELDEIYTGTRPDMLPGTYAMIGASDTGSGMDKDTLARIFEPFFTTKGKDRGTGLGLATSYGIIRQHGGDIIAYSEPGKGTTFKIYLPFVEEKTFSRAEIRDVIPRPTFAATILVIEDEPAVSNLVCRLLSGHGYSVIQSASAADALAKAAGHPGPIRLVLADVIMPEMKGPEVYASIKKHHPESRVLYMSGYTDNVIVRHGILQEGVQFLQKPFTVRSLLTKVGLMME